MKVFITILIIAVIGIAGFYALNSYIYNEKQGEGPIVDQRSDVRVSPISHATMVLQWDDTVMYTDPVGGSGVFSGQPRPDIILITDIHGDHLNVETVETVLTDETMIIAPQAVADQLPEALQDRVTILANNQSVAIDDFQITALPMYNLPESNDARHVKGRGNGYLLENATTRVYVAGDTAGIPEMRALENIDIAFVPMNVPFTMSVDEAADAVLDFKPAVVYPFHYRGSDGLADVERFKRLVNESDENIEVVLLDWYPEQ